MVIKDLSPTFLSILFNVEYKLDEITIISISDEIEAIGFIVTDIVNNDPIIRYNFSINNKYCHLTINRLESEFEIFVESGGWNIFPVYGNWQTIKNFMISLINSG